LVRVAPSADHHQSLRASREHQSSIVRHERDRTTELLLQVQATRQLHRVAGSQRIPQEQSSSVGRDLRSQLDHRERRHVVLKGRQHAVALFNRERPLARPSHNRR
jgi:hypothetical protein